MPFLLARLRQTRSIFGRPLFSPGGSDRTLSTSSIFLSQARSTQEEDVQVQSAPRGHVFKLSRAFRPWDTMADPRLGMHPAEIRQSVTAFASHSGLLYTLMASMGIVGVMWDASSSSGLPQVDVDIPMGGVTSLLSEWLNVDAGVVLPSLTAPLFCIASFLNLQGLLLSMLALGRAYVIPEKRIPQFVRENSTSLHMMGWCLIPAVASLASGLVCAIHHLHGEPCTSLAFFCLLGLGGSVSYQTVKLGLSTDRLCDEMMGDGSPALSGPSSAT